MSTLVEEIQEPVARLKYPDAKVLKTVIDALAKIVDEALFKVSESGVKVSGMDPAKISMIVLDFPRESFLEYEVNEPIDIGFSMESLKNVLKRGKKGDTVDVMATQDKVLIVIESGIVKRYLLPNLEILSDMPEDINLEFDVEALIMSDAFKKTLKDAETVGDVIEFEATEDALILRGKGDGRSRVEAKFTRDTTALIDLDVKNPATSAYDISYLKNVVNLTGIADTIEVKFSQDRPLMLVFRSPEGSRVLYLLAPSI